MADENFAPTIRCYNCGKVIANHIVLYNQLLDDGHTEMDALDAVSWRGIRTECCRNMILSELDPYSMMKPESGSENRSNRPKHKSKKNTSNRKSESSDQTSISDNSSSEESQGDIPSDDEDDSNNNRSDDE